MTLTLMQKTGLGALAFETSAVALLFLHSDSTTLLYRFFLLHAIASLLASVAVWCLLPPHYRQPRKLVLSLLFCLCFFIPILGVAGFLAGVLLAQLMPHLRQQQPFAKTANPTFHNPKSNAPSAQLRTGQWRSQLEETDAPIELRVRALIAIHNVSARSASASLRQALSDQEDDLRLLAYGMLEAQESHIMADIHHLLESLPSAGSDHARFRAHKKLAELYWELVYQMLALGDMRRHALEQARLHASEALTQDAGDAGSYLLLGRICLQLNDLPAAEDAFAMARALGISAQRADPYLAELAFMQRRYPEVRKRMTRFRHKDSGQNMAPIANFWGKA